MPERRNIAPPEAMFVVPEGEDLANFLEKISRGHKLPKKGVVNYHGINVPFEENSDVDQVKRQIEEALRRQLQ